MKDWFEVPVALRTWFTLHGLVSIGLGLALFVAPEALLHLAGWTPFDPGATRLVAAALLAMGVTSYRARQAGLPVIRTLLGLKILWSGLAVIALFGAIGAGAPSVAWILVFAFLIFLGVWTHHAIVFRRLEAAGPEAFAYGDPEAPEGASDEPREDAHEAPPSL